MSRRGVSLRGERLLDGLHQRGIVRLGAGVEAGDELAVAAHEELAEVPRHGTGQRGAFAGERVEERVLLRAGGDADLGEEGKVTL